MAKFLILYKSPMSFEQQMANATPEQMQAGMEPWMAWFGKYAAQITDMGSPLAHGQTFTADGSSDSQSQIAGYSFIEASDMNAVRAIVDGHPHFMSPGNTIDVLEVMPMQM
jgi:hypothetical protein